IRSEASMTLLAPSLTLPISAILPPATATSARYRGVPVPSTTVAFLISKSYICSPPFLGERTSLPPPESIFLTEGLLYLQRGRQEFHRRLRSHLFLFRKIRYSCHEQ